MFLSDVSLKIVIICIVSNSAVLQSVKSGK